MHIETVARICHEVNRAYCEGIGDNSQKFWDEAEEWQRTSAIEGVKFSLLNPDATSEDQHKTWMKDKYLDGWKYGPNKDPEKKEHPCLVAYNTLPKEQRIKDALFQSVVLGCVEDIIYDE